MSLVGNLEDLSLGDILQIISLSQKSGVLVLRSDHGHGRIVFRSGLVHGAHIKGWPDGLRAVLLQGGFVDEAGFDAAAARAAERGVPVEETVARETGLGRERLATLTREAVEASILEMFAWDRGEFSFDMRSESEPGDPELVLPNGLNGQYLAMEGMRIRDERTRSGAAAGGGAAAEAGPDVADGSDDEPDLVLSGEDGAAEEEPPSAPESFATLDEATDAVELLEVEAVEATTLDAADVLVATVLEREAAEDDEGSEGAEDALLEPEGLLESDAAETGEVAVPTASGAATTAAPAPPSGPEPSSVREPSGPSLPVILIDPDVAVLEWIKKAIADRHARVHVFQQAEQGLSRIRQYVVRGERPIVLISPSAEVDPLSGIRGLPDFVRRLKAQAPGMPVIGVHATDGPDETLPPELDAVLERPSRKALRSEPEDGVSPVARAFAESLDDLVVRHREARSAIAAARRNRGDSGVQELREATAKLREASTRGSILPVVLDYAAELFGRVAMLVVRDGRVHAIGGRGLDGINGEAARNALRVDALGEGWIHDVLSTRRAVRGEPRTPGDAALLAHLGVERPAAAYLGPIESGGAVIALLYADGADHGGGPSDLPDTSALEVVLHHAGLALDRAALERALSESEQAAR